MSWTAAESVRARRDPHTELAAVGWPLLIELWLPTASERIRALLIKLADRTLSLNSQDMDCNVIDRWLASVTECTSSECKSSDVNLTDWKMGFQNIYGRWWHSSASGGGGAEGLGS